MATAERDARFWNRIAARYAQRPIDDQAAYERKIAMTRERLSPEMTVLELGCGTGSTALAHAPFVKEIVATDISPAMIDIARRKAAEAGVGNVRFDVASVETAAYAAERFDVVLALNMLHLVEAPAEAIQKARRWLKPGGLFISSTPCLRDDYPMLRFIAPIARALGYFPRLTFFTEQEHIAAHSAAGLVEETRWRAAAGKTVFMIARATETPR